MAALLLTSMELPPRARRIPSTLVEAGPIVGTTSACAENTDSGKRASAYQGNYLRVRGEYRGISSVTSSHMELPPRARRIQQINDTMIVRNRTTSACAENT